MAVNALDVTYSALFCFDDGGEGEGGNGKGKGKGNASGNWDGDGKVDM